MLFPHAMDHATLSMIVMVNSFASTANATMTPTSGPTSAPIPHRHHQAAVVAALANPPAPYSAKKNHTLNIGVLHQFHPLHKHHSRSTISARVETEEVRLNAMKNTTTTRKEWWLCPLGGTTEVQDVEK